MEREIFSKLSKNLKNNSLLSKIPSDFRIHTYKPHITIGRGLNHGFALAHNMFKQQYFFQNFTVAEVHLLKRNNLGRYESIQKFPFLSRASPQSTLF